MIVSLVVVISGDHAVVTDQLKGNAIGTLPHKFHPTPRFPPSSCLPNSGLRISFFPIFLSSSIFSESF